MQVAGAVQFMQGSPLLDNFSTLRNLRVNGKKQLAELTQSYNFEYDSQQKRKKKRKENRPKKRPHAFLTVIEHGQRQIVSVGGETRVIRGVQRGGVVVVVDTAAAGAASTTAAAAAAATRQQVRHLQLVLQLLHPLPLRMLTRKNARHFTQRVRYNFQA